jgi:hypothetical protein
VNRLYHFLNMTPRTRNNNLGDWFLCMDVDESDHKVA